jgi:hypothetical protein
LIRRLLVNGPLCYYKRLLHLQICLLFPLILTPIWALFFLIFPQDPNSEGQMQKHLLLAHRRRLLRSFLLYSTAIYMSVKLHPSSVYMI